MMVVNFSLLQALCALIYKWAFYTSYHSLMYDPFELRLLQSKSLPDDDDKI